MSDRIREISDRSLGKPQLLAYSRLQLGKIGRRSGGFVALPYGVSPPCTVKSAGECFNPPNKREAVPSGDHVKCRIRDPTCGVYDRTCGVYDHSLEIPKLV